MEKMSYFGVNFTIVVVCVVLCIQCNGVFMKVLILWCCAMMAAPFLAAQEDVLRPNGRTQTSVGAQSGVASASSSSGHSGVFALGLEAGLGVNFFSQTLNESALDPRLVPIFKSANGLGGFINAVIDYSLSPSIGLQGRFGYQSKNVTFSGTYLENCTDVFGTFIEQTTIDYQQKSSGLNYYNLGLSLRVNATENLMFLIGPTINIINNSAAVSSETKQTIVNSENCWFYTTDPVTLVRDSSKTVTTTTNINGANTTRFGIDISAAYKIPLTHNWAFIPRVGFQYFVTPAFENETFQDQNGNQIILAQDRALHSLQFGVGLLYYFH